MEKAVLVIDLLHARAKIGDPEHHAGLRYRLRWAQLMPHGPRRTGKPGESSGALIDDERLLEMQQEFKFLEDSMRREELAEVINAIIYNVCPRALVVEQNDYLKLRASDRRKWILLMSGLASLARAHASWSPQRAA